MKNNINSNPSKTLLTISLGFLVIYIVTKSEFAIYTSTIVSIIGVISNSLSLFIEKIWFKIAMVLSLIIPNIILTIIFYFILFPISLFAKIKSNSNFSTEYKSTSMYIKTNKLFDKNSFLNPW